MPVIGDDSAFEQEYMAKLNAFLTSFGITLSYGRDLAGIDTGVHLYTDSESGARMASQVRIWIQAKGKKSSTLSNSQFQAAQTVAVSLRVDHVRFWYAAPEPVYLVVYVESADLFIAEDVRDIVDRQWPRGNFYEDVPATQENITLRVLANQVLDEKRVPLMLRHRSLRIDGPSYRGRPLGHRYDPLRSCLAPLQPDLFLEVSERLLHEHGFAGTLEPATDGLYAGRGRLYTTLEWQSSAFAEYGYGPDSDLRVEPDVEWLHGDLVLIIDCKPDRRSLLPEQHEALSRFLGRQGQGLENSGDTLLPPALIMFNSLDLSSAGGTWRALVGRLPAESRPATTKHIGREALTSLLLVTTLVYLEFSDRLRWDHVNFR